ncbi:hypothetical protein HGM15179_003356 [Zosterops borbonicus]|uniref:Uncharacterized protein n=1 Tax=Zosterops borbonicus TaxID=364589 RepID=A0A8K1GR66_9PASS|nr:hypothetical protein HGM15179_003356 [Zosterops borbonicus]
MKRKNPLPPSDGQVDFDAAQDTNGCKGTLPSDAKIFVHQNPKVLFLRVALNPFSAQSVFLLDLAQVQNHAFGLVEPHEDHPGPPLKPVKIPLDGIAFPPAC